jgi:hypothetical protein
MCIGTTRANRRCRNRSRPALRTCLQHYRVNGEEGGENDNSLNGNIRRILISQVEIGEKAPRLLREMDDSVAWQGSVGGVAVEEEQDEVDPLEDEVENPEEEESEVDDE